MSAVSRELDRLRMELKVQKLELRKHSDLQETRIKEMERALKELERAVAVEKLWAERLRLDLASRGYKVPEKLEPRSALKEEL